MTQTQKQFEHYKLLKDAKKALTLLAEHAQEKYPHFESERGQQDIQRAFDILNRMEELGL